MIALNITTKAQHYLTNVLLEQQSNAILLSLKQKGCSGFAYQIECINRQNIQLIENCQKIVNVLDIENCQKIVNVLDKDDTSSNNIIIYIPENYAQKLSGLTIDLTQHNFGEKLTFHHPNTSKFCGCGESFQFISEVDAK